MDVQTCERTGGSVGRVTDREGGRGLKHPAGWTNAYNYGGSAASVMTPANG